MQLVTRPRADEEPRTAMLSAYARAIGLRNALPTTGPISGHLADDFNKIIESIGRLVGPEISDLLMDSSFFWGGERKTSKIGGYCDATVLLSKVSQLISYLEHLHHLNSDIVEIGSLFNSIKNPELKNRCSDLLSAPGNFDRAINQATLVLEDKLRQKSKIDKSLTGPNLVNAVINSSPEKGLLRVSKNDEEHEGFAHICRGVMLAFRNPTHHTLTDNYSREDALKVCAFIDNLIRTIDEADEIKK